MALLQISEPGLSAAPHQRRLAAGIDLGTTNSLVATVRSGQAETLPDHQGRYLLPSVVNYHASGLTVGYDARLNAAQDPANTISSVKRMMGRSLADIQHRYPHLPYQLQASENGLPMIQTAGGLLNPIRVSADILKALAARATEALAGELDGVVITVPAYFDDAQRQGKLDRSEERFSRNAELRAALRLYTSSWRYLYGVKAGAIRVDLDGNPCGELEEQHIAHARQQLEEAKARVQAQRAAQQAKKREAAAAAGQPDEGVRRERKPRPQQPRRKEGAEQRKPRPVAAKAPREERLTPVSDVSVLTVGQALKVKAGNNAMDATVLEITKDGVRVQLTSGMSMIVRAEHLVF